LLELDELQRFDDARVGLLFRDVLLVQAVGDVVLDGEGVEESGLLKDHPDVGAELEEVALGHGDDVFAEDEDVAGVGPDEAVGELHEDGFAAAGGTEDHASLARGDRKGDVHKNRLQVKGNGHLLEDDDRILISYEIRLCVVAWK